jgi:two-component system, cell cycle sensor histidine kinase PleC
MPHDDSYPYRKLLWDTNIAVYVAQDGVIRNPNPASLMMYGYSEQELTGKPFTAFVHPDDRAMVQDRYDRCARGESDVPTTYSFRIINGAGETRYVELNVVASTWEDRPAIFCFQEDITRIKEAEDALRKSHYELELSVQARTEELRQSEERFRDFAKTASDWFWEMDAELRFTYGSDRFFEITGVEASDVYGRERKEIVSQTDMEADSKKWRLHFEQLENRQPFRNLEYSITTADNRVIHITVNGDPLFNDEGIFVGYRGTGAEITKRKATERALQESEERFRDFVETSTDWLWETDDAGQITWQSASGGATDGYTENSVRGKTREEIAGSAMSDSDWAAYRQALKQHTDIKEFQYVYEGLDNNIHYVVLNGKALFDGAGTYIGHRGTANDVTDRKHSEATLQKLYFAINMLDERISLYDSDDRLIFCNQSFRDLNAATPKMTEHGVTLEDQLRASVTAGQIPDAIGREDEWLAERMERHRNPQGPFEIPRQNGIVLQVHEQKLADGNTILVSTDIGREKRAQEKMLVAMALAEKANRAKSEFLATMSHEFRTPLNAILGFSEMMRAQYFGPLGAETYESYVNDIHLSGEHMLALVNDVLDITAIEAGKRPLIYELIDVGELLTGSVRNVEKAAEDGGVVLSLDVPDNLPSLYADRRSIIQVFLNVLSNATKFTTRDGEINVSARAEYGTLVIVVKDTGIGIPIDKLDTITDPFTQANSNPHNAQEGTGLGLSIVKSLVEANDGSLHIESEVGTGTTVSVTFPCSDPSQAL